jgi:hypothetical protein
MQIGTKIIDIETGATFREILGAIRKAIDLQETYCEIIVSIQLIVGWAKKIIGIKSPISFYS